MLSTFDDQTSLHVSKEDIMSTVYIQDNLIEIYFEINKTKIQLILFSKSNFVSLVLVTSSQRSECIFRASFKVFLCTLLDLKTDS